MGMDPEQQKRMQQHKAEMERLRAEQLAEHKSKAVKAETLATNKKNLVAAQRSGTVNVVVAKRGPGKVTVLIGSGHDQELTKATKADGVHGHIDVTATGLVVTQNVKSPAFEAEMKRITPTKVSYKHS